jgi:hypothetical protein
MSRTRGAPIDKATIAVASAAAILLLSVFAGILAGTNYSASRAEVQPPSGTVPPPDPYIQHVVVVVLENEVLSEVWQHGPYERYLAGTYGNATSYYATCHPSAPNYLAMFAGVANQCGSDTWHNYTNNTLGQEFDAANLTWGAFAESLPSNACSSPGSATVGMFATRHVPALFFSSVLTNQTYCHDHVENSSVFNGSVANGTLRNYSYYTPNLCDDGHNGCGGNTTPAQMTSQADAWLEDWLSPILNHTGRCSNPAERALINHTAFILTWDEGTGSNAGFAVTNVTRGDNYLWCGQNGESGDASCGGQIFTAIVSPYSLHTTFSTNDSVYGLCRTVEWLFDLPPLGNPGSLDDQAGYPPMSSLFNFSASFNVTVNETGLPTGTDWWFNVSGVAPESTNGSALNLSLANGSYSFHARAANRSWTTPNGTFAVNGSPVWIELNFSAGKTLVTFDEYGLPAGTFWDLNISGVSEPGTRNQTVVESLDDGLYGFEATTANSTWSSPRGNFTVDGLPVLVNVTFSRVTFSVTVTEVGLTPGVAWWLNLTGGPNIVGPLADHSVSLPNGSVPYTAQADGNVWSRDAGVLLVNGTASTANVSFSLVLFTVSFLATGLASGAIWNLTFEGATQPEMAGDSPTYSESNGSYAYVASGPSNAPPLRPSGNFSVAGETKDVVIPFDPAFSIAQFNATPGNLSLGGSLLLEVTLSGGTAPFHLQYVGLPAGCETENSTAVSCTPSAPGRFTITVEASDAVGARTVDSATIQVGSAPTGVGSPSSSASSLPAWVLLAVGVVLVVIALGVLVVWRRSRGSEDNERP